MIPGSANPLLLASAASAPASYSIDRSLRFNSSDSAYLSRTPASAGNRKTWTWAGWVKRSALGGRQTLFIGYASGAQADSFELDADKLRFLTYNSAILSELKSTAVLRDASAWYHLLLSFDTTQATSTNRVKLYINGNAVTQFDTASYPAQNYDSTINAANLTVISRSDSLYFDGYLADIHFIDGQALGPTSFGEFDDNGIWQPKEYTGTYGTNGFHLAFSDNSTAGSLGDDSSGAGNNWTVNNISVAAGAGNDSLVDVPTNGTETDSGLGAEVRGNYCMLNPLDRGDVTVANGNLDSNRGTFIGSQQIRGTTGVSSGKWYWEVALSTDSGFDDSCIIGIANSSATMSTNGSGNFWGYVYTGVKFSNSSTSSYGASFTNGDVVGIAFDADNGSLTFYKNNVSQGTAFAGLAANTYFPCSSMNGAKLIHNFGQRPFAYPAPSGFKALCTANLPSTTITTSGSYTGNGVADGPFVYLNGVPTVMTVNGTAVTFGTHADKLSNGFKLRTTSTTYNQNAATYNYSVTSTGPTFKTARAQAN